MGHLLKIVNCLVMSGDTDEQLRDVLKTNLSKEMFSRWSDFLSGPVADQNKKNDTNLVCVRVRSAHKVAHRVCVCTCQEHVRHDSEMVVLLGIFP